MHAPCPNTREEALTFLRVLECEGPESDEYRWRGYVVADPEALSDLTPEDRAAWDAWVAEPKTAAFLDGVIAQCRAQAAANRGNTGHMVLLGQRPTDRGSGQ